MSALREYFNLAVGALLLKPETYEKMREERNPFVKGLILIVLVGAIVAALSIVGKVLEWSVTPDLSNLKNIVLQEMQGMAWFKEMASNPRALEGFRQGYDMMWQFMTPMFAVDVLGAVLNIIFNPLMLVITWLIYTVVAFVFARVLGGKGTLNQTLGCTALAVAPQMLNAAHIFPYAQVGAVGMWVLVCSYLGLKVSGRLTPWRAFWATILPFVLLALIVLLFGCVAIAALSSGGGSR